MWKLKQTERRDFTASSSLPLLSAIVSFFSCFGPHPNATIRFLPHPPPPSSLSFRSSISRFFGLIWSRKFSNIYFLYIKRKGGPPFMECGNMGLFDRGVQMLLTTVGAFAAFSLMTIAVGTDYWLYSRGVCRSKSMSENETSKKNEEVMTHSGLWRTCCLEGKRKVGSSVVL